MQGLHQLQQAWAHRTLIPVVGAGVSIGAANLPTWSKLLQNGIGYIQRHKRDLQIRSTAISALKGVADEGDLIEGFELLQKRLGGAPDSVHYQAFLNEQFAEPHIEDSRTLEALRNLRVRLVVTTNYDLLLQMFQVVTDPQVATWLEPRQILSLLRGGRGIIHLHGRYDLSQSVILSGADYSRIVNRPEDSVTIARALFHGGVLMFVGCSLEAVHDPHLGKMLGEFSRLHGPILQEAGRPHYMLVKGRPTAEEVVRLRELGVVPLSYGQDYSDLPRFLNSIPQRPVSAVRTENIRTLLYTLRGAQSRSELLSDIKTFLKDTVYRGRQIRVGFAAKVEEGGRTVLRNKYLHPEAATHNEFSYPQTFAAWALIEGRILVYPGDLDLRCDFNHLRRLRKYERVRAELLSTDPGADPVMGNFLSAETIKQKTRDGTLTIRDIYQHWVGRQPDPHYQQFVSVPVPIVEKIVNVQNEPREHGVINIDTKDPDPLVTEETKPLLKLASDLVTLAFELRELEN